MSELKTNIIQKPVENPMLCMVCNHATRCNYNLTGRKDPLCEECFLGQIPKPVCHLFVKNIRIEGFIFRILKTDGNKFIVEVDESCNSFLHFTLDKSFDSVVEADEFISHYLSKLRRFA